MLQAAGFDLSAVRMDRRGSHWPAAAVFLKTSEPLKLGSIAESKTSSLSGGDGPRESLDAVAAW